MQLLGVFCRAWCLWLGTGQGETENSTSVGIGTGPKPAMVRLNNSTADIEPHAQAFRLGAVKRFEQAFWIFQSVATVDDRDLDQGSLVGNNYVQYPVFDRGHGLKEDRKSTRLNSSH